MHPKADELRRQRMEREDEARRAGTKKWAPYRWVPLGLKPGSVLRTTEQISYHSPICTPNTNTLPADEDFVVTGLHYVGLGFPAWMLNKGGVVLASVGEEDMAKFLAEGSFVIMSED